MTVYLDYDTVVAINLEHVGAGVRDEGGLRGAVARPATGFGDQEHFPTLWLKAAVLLHAIASTQYLYDGNKRTGYICAETFLVLNGVRLSRIPVIHSEAFVRAVAEDLLSIEAAAEWFQAAAKHPLRRGLVDRSGRYVLTRRRSDRR